MTRQNMSTRIAIAAVALVAASLGSVGLASPAAADGCSVPPCGALTNHVNRDIGVRYRDHDKDPWSYLVVHPDHTLGGWWNDGRDIDEFFVPDGCSYLGGIGGRSHTWGPGWQKISSNQTVVISSYYC